MLKTTAFLIFVLCSSAHIAVAQTGNVSGPAAASNASTVNESPRWMKFRSDAEEFTIETPGPLPVYEMSRSVRDSLTFESEPARVYPLYHDGVVYLIASLDNPRRNETLEYFTGDVSGKPSFFARGTFKRNVFNGKHEGLEYEISEHGLKGVARYFLTSKHAYMVAAFGDDESNPSVRRYLNSFNLTAKQLPRANDIDTSSAPKSQNTNEGFGTGAGVGVGVGEGRGYGPGRGANIGGGERQIGGGGPGPHGPVDYNGVFNRNEVTRRAIPVFKPDPGYTEQARRNNVAGVVRLRAVFLASGKLDRITLVKGLPDGLTERAMAAARGILFIPAQKDGRSVSQHVTLEYNFNIY
ncbi:MAG TPA: energy transducer TonB [Pyrinomonadaceae bacterium]|nr:energy transducer TonB [Pyrinomonadaceae bacterium]